MGNGVFDAMEEIGREREGESAGDDSGDHFGLIVSAFPLPIGMKRHGDDDIGATKGGFSSHALSDLFPQAPTDPGLCLQAKQIRPQRSVIRPDETEKVQGHPFTPATALPLGGRRSDHHRSVAATAARVSGNIGTPAGRAGDPLPQPIHRAATEGTCVGKN
jgi:hypothetical protein